MMRHRIVISLLLNTLGGALRLHKPVAYQFAADGTRIPIAARFIVSPNNRELRFALAPYDRTRTLVIDPVITYATYVAGTAGSTPTAIASDASGNVYLTGYTASAIASFGGAATSSSPTGLVPSTTKSAAFLAQLAPAASGSQIAWITYYGSTQATVQPNALALQPGGAMLYLGGQTIATNLPGTGGSTTTFDHAPTANGNTFGFLATFATGTGAFNATTYVEGTSTAAGSTIIAALAADSSGNITAVGQTTGKSFPTTSTALYSPGLSAVIANTSLLKGIILRLEPTLTTEAYGTYLAGDISATTASTTLTSVALDSASNIYLSGNTYGDFPQAGVYPGTAVNTAPAGKLGTDAFACELVPSTATLPYVYWSGGQHAHRQRRRHRHDQRRPARQLQLPGRHDRAAVHRRQPGRANHQLRRRPSPLTYPASPVTLSATSSSGLPVTLSLSPGSVLFYDGANQIGSGYITAGIAAFSTNALSVGSHAITAVYGGDIDFSGGTSPVATEVITDYSIATGSGSMSITTATVHRGQTASYSIVVTPSGTAFAAPVTFTVTGLPTGATATFTPSTIAAGAASTSVAIAVAVPSNLAQLSRPARQRAREVAPIAFALMLLPIWMQRRKTRRLAQALLASLLLVIAATTLTGCAGYDPAPETYTMTVTASSSGLTRTTTLFLIVG